MVENGEGPEELFSEELASFFSILDRKAGGEEQVDMGLSQEVFGLRLIEQLFYTEFELPDNLVALSQITPQLYQAALAVGDSRGLLRRK